MNILIILLGCNILKILNDRVNTAVEFAINREKIYNDNIIWFLSGGIKYNNINNEYQTISEAQQMRDIILNEREKRKSIKNKTIVDNIHENYSYENWNFILDTNSTNTAENFIMVNKLLLSVDKNYIFDSIFVITSKYHYKRAKIIADYINKNNTYEWILSPVEERNSYYLENIHIKNAEKDVIESMQKFNLIR